MSRTIISKQDDTKLKIVREFDAPVQQVWRAWTEAELLDQWWAPKPWKTDTRTMNFSNGGMWLYCMVGPEGEQHFCRADFDNIVPLKSYMADDVFCDESGNPNSEIPSMHWENHFFTIEKGTEVVVQVSFASKEALKTIVEMGFEEGFTAAHCNLDELLAKR